MSDPLPVVVFAFNRPRKLKRVLQALSTQPIDRMMIFVDGPRDAGDMPLVEQSRTLARQVNWAPVELHLWEDNRGLNGFIDNISLVMEAYCWAIFVEDDCLPMPGYCSFMRQALEHYIDRPEVFSIGAYQPLTRCFFKDYPFSLVSSLRFNCWGWATWRDRWLTVLPDVGDYKSLFNYLRDIPDIAGLDLPFAVRAMARGEMRESWDTKVAVASLSRNMVHLQSTCGLVRNFGLDRSGMHGSFRGIIRDALVHNWNLTRTVIGKPTWLENLAPDENYVVQLQQFIRSSRNLSINLLVMRIKDVLGL